MSLTTAVPNTAIRCVQGRSQKFVSEGDKTGGLETESPSGGKGKKGKDVDSYSAFHAPGTPNAHVTETRPPDRHLGHRPACNTQPVQ